MKGNTVRILLFLLAASALVFTGCSESGDVLDSSPGGRVQFTLSTSSTAPLTSGDDCEDDDDDCDDDGNHGGDRPHVTAVNVTFTAIVARNFDGELIDVTIDLPYTVDLMSLERDRTVTLPAGFLPPGTYDQLVMVMSDVALTTLNGTVITITPPGGGWTAVVPTCPFTVTEGGETTVQLLFKGHNALRWRDGRFHFHPAFECEDDSGGEVDPI